ncbi:MAG: MM0924 family protein [Candidatus Helarchaeota archaeon]
MDKFISEHLLHKEIDVILDNDIIVSGLVVASADRVLTLSKDGKYTYINIDQVKYIQEK